MGSQLTQHHPYTPTQPQVAKFIVWIEKNPACVHLLNQLWDLTHQQKKAVWMDQGDLPASGSGLSKRMIRGGGGGGGGV